MRARHTSRLQPNHVPGSRPHDARRPWPACPSPHHLSHHAPRTTSLAPRVTRDRCSASPPPYTHLHGQHPLHPARLARPAAVECVEAHLPPGCRRAPCPRQSAAVSASPCTVLHASRACCRCRPAALRVQAHQLRPAALRVRAACGAARPCCAAPQLRSPQLRRAASCASAQRTCRGPLASPTRYFTLARLAWGYVISQGPVSYASETLHRHGQGGTLSTPPRPATQTPSDPLLTGKDPVRPVT
jgi:hypothetical protein